MPHRNNLLLIDTPDVWQITEGRQWRLDCFSVQIIPAAGEIVQYREYYVRRWHHWRRENRRDYLAEKAIAGMISVHESIRSTILKMPAQSRASSLAIGNVQSHFQAKAHINKFRLFPHPKSLMKVKDHPIISHKPKIIWIYKWVHNNSWLILRYPENHLDNIEWEMIIKNKIHSSASHV